jgi:hypothetical protein
MIQMLASEPLPAIFRWPFSTMTSWPAFCRRLRQRATVARAKRVFSHSLPHEPKQLPISSAKSAKASRTSRSAPSAGDFVQT